MELDGIEPVGKPEAGVSDDDDQSFVYESDSEHEVYEEESDDYLVNETDSVVEDAGLVRNADYVDWLSDFQSLVRRRDRVHTIAELLDEEEAGDDVDWDGYEHLPGPTCQTMQRYNGNVISVEEMKYCNTFQCLVPKSRAWKPEPDDEDFERGSSYFLSGLGHHMPSRDERGPDVFPARHGETDLYADDFFGFVVDSVGSNSNILFTSADSQYFRQKQPFHFTQRALRYISMPLDKNGVP
jgi:hypothetical protein